MNLNRIIVVLSGEIASGKSSLSNKLEKDFQFKILKSKDAIASLAARKKIRKDDRAALQRLGDKLDQDTNGEWLVNFFQNEILNHKRLVIDSVRIIEQINSFRRSYGYQNVLHIHVHASAKTLERRYFQRNDIQDFNDIVEINKYKQYKSNETEKNVNKLLSEADLILDTENFSLEDNLIQTVSFLRLLPSTYTRTVDVIVGAQFGSEGKGQIAGYLSPNYDCLVRVGGPNAGHKVFNTPNIDTFHILPSGTRRAPNAKIIIGPGAVISKEVILDEILKFELEPKRLVIDENATIISQEDISLENDSNIGSTKQGVGGATANNILMRLKSSDAHKAKNCKELRQLIGNTHREFEILFSENKKILLEGTKGTFLSLHHGFYPFVTSRDTSASGCMAEAGFSPLRVRKIIMVTRRYPIRVQNPKGGSSGPFSRHEYETYLKTGKIEYDSEITFDIIKERSDHKEDLKQLEKTSTTKLYRRVAEFNWPLLREAAEINSPTDIALTFADYINYSNRFCRRYDQLTEYTKKFIEEMERCTGANVSLIATGFEYRSIIDKRNWI